MNANKVNRVIIAGGGTAGWITAALFAKAFGRSLNLMLIESDDIPTVGVGEATIPPILNLHRTLELSEREFMSRVNGTFKLGIAFENWRNVGEKYIHSFGFAGRGNWTAGFHHFWLAGLKRGLATAEYGDYCAEHLACRHEKFAVMPKNGVNYAYHFDAGLYAKHLREYSEKYGLVRKEGKIVQVNLNPDSGHIKSLQLASGEVVDGDLFIDCSGFRGLLINDALKTEYEDWSHWLPCDSAVAMQTETVRPPIPYTRSIAHPVGWQWRIPLQSRVGNGLVFCSKYISDDDAKELLKKNVEGKPLNDPRVIKFRTGTRKLHWNKNCVAIGLSSGFLEPLESTSIHLIQRSATKLIQMFPVHGIKQTEIDEFNRQMQIEAENIRDFIILHYHVTERDDSEFWRYCRTMDVPETVKHKINLFKETGKIFKRDMDLFAEESWLQVMLGQGIMPESYHPVADAMSDDALRAYLQELRETTRDKVDRFPEHQEFIDYYCKSTVI